MSWTRILRLRLRSVFRRRIVEQELDEEIRYHLERRIEELVAKGLTADEARYAALRLIGSMQQRKDECRDTRRVTFIEHCAQDLRYAARLMKRSPSFSTIAILVMAFGIAGSTAVFSLFDSVLLKPLPFADPARLVMVWEENTQLGMPRADVAAGNYLDWKDQADAFEDLAAFYGNAFNLTEAGEPERLDGFQTTPNLFPLLGVKPALGRTFNNDEGLPGKDQVTILSYGLWQRKFGGNAAIVGSSIRINDQPYLVAGVMPQGFQFPRGDTQLWVPSQFPRTESGPSARNIHFLRVIGRLKPGVSWQQAENQIRTIAHRLAETYPVTNRNFDAAVYPLHQEFVRDTRISLWLLLGAAILVLVIACANVANMLLTRGIGRVHEVALRTALGGSRSRVARQLLIEGLLLAAISAMFGVVAAAVGVRLMDKMVPPALSGAVYPSIDFRVLAFSISVSLLTGIAFGLAPLRQAFRLDLSQAFRARTSINLSRSRSRAFLVSLETALAIVVVASTGLVVRTIVNIGAVDPGFRSDHTLTLRLELTATRYATADSRIGFYRDVLTKIRTIPGVVSAGLTTFLPYTNIAGTNGFFVEGRTERPPLLYRREVSPDYLQTLRVPLRQGRWFTDADDRDHPPVVIISESAARYFAGNPIGKRVRLGAVTGPWSTVVGVVGDIREESLDQPSQRATAYIPLAQMTSVAFFNPRDLAIRVQGEPLSIVQAVRREVWSIDREQPIAQVRTLEDLVQQQVSGRKLQGLWLSTFSLVALLLAAVGVYGLLSFMVQSRTHEFGVRMALGARTKDLVFDVLRQSFVWIGCGMLAGLVIALFATRSLSSVLYGVKPSDPLTLAAAAFLLFAVGVIGASIPAWRVTKVDPMTALREE